MKYTDIGHSNQNDVLWILIEDDLYFIEAGFDRTHELAWGGIGDVTNCWRGRLEHQTYRCSIACPSEQISAPPETLLGRLRKRLNVGVFYYFSNGNFIGEL